MTQSDLIALDEELIDRLQDEKPDTIEKIQELLHQEIEAGFVKGITIEDGKITMAFPYDPSQPTQWQAYAEILMRLEKHSKVAHHASAKLLQPTPEEMKYFCRNWLVQLGLGGAEHKETRKILFGHLTGFAAFRSSDQMDAHTPFDSGFFCVRVGRGLLEVGSKDRSPPRGRGVAAGESSGLPGPGPRRGRTGAEAGVGSGSRGTGSRDGRRGATARAGSGDTDRVGCAGPPGKSRGRRRASAGNAGVTGLVAGGTRGIWAAPTRHTRADRAGVPGKNRRDPGQNPGFPGRVPGTRGGKSRFPGGKNPVFQVIVPGV